MNEKEIVKLKEENEQLKAKLAKAEDEIRRMRKQLGISFSPLTVKDFQFQSTPKPHLVVKHTKVYFESDNDSAAVLAQAICEDRGRVQKMLKDIATLEDIYEWVGRGDWFDAESEERKQFKKDVYQWFRRLNDKIGKRIFQNVNNGYRISRY